MIDQDHKPARLLRSIAIFKWSKASILTILGIGLFGMHERSVFARAIYSIGHSILGHFFVKAAAWFTALPHPTRLLLHSAAFAYAGLFLIEGIGLWLKKLWAEWLTAIMTSLLIPVEMYEVFERQSWERITLLVLNTLIAAYLIGRLLKYREPHRHPSSPARIDQPVSSTP